jgi:predicted nucleotidyltransferase
MPVRSSTSSVLKWPDRASVVAALEAWAAGEASRHAGLLRLGYYGSYARGNWGVGSDVDLIAIVEGAAGPFERRALDWDLLDLPVPAEIVVYTREEWERLRSEGGRFARTIERDTVWLSFPTPPEAR